MSLSPLETILICGKEARDRQIQALQRIINKTNQRGWHGVALRVDVC